MDFLFVCLYQHHWCIYVCTMYTYVCTCIIILTYIYESRFQGYTKKAKELLKYSQVKLLVPHRVQFLGHCACSLFHLANLHRHIRITRTAFILRYQALSTNHCTVRSDRLIVMVFHSFQHQSEPSQHGPIDCNIPWFLFCLLGFMWKQIIAFVCEYLGINKIIKITVLIGKDHKYSNIKR